MELGKGTFEVGSTSKGSSHCRGGGDRGEASERLPGRERRTQPLSARYRGPAPCVYSTAEEVGVRSHQGRRSYGKKVTRNIIWADEVGGVLTEEEATCEDFIEEKLRCTDEETCEKICPRRPGDGPVKAPLEDCLGAAPDAKVAQAGCPPGRDGHPSPLPPRCESYKEVLLLLGAGHLRLSASVQGSRVSERVQRRLMSSKRAVRCFRCLALGHLAFACRDPVRCRSCWKSGHKALQCKERPARRAVEATMNQLRAHHHRERTHKLKAFVPLTEEYLRRVELRRNAVLADIIQPADLGNAPQQTIANALASRFGGYPHDFYVARHRERDFAIILPRWVSAETLTRPQIITLEAF